MDKQRYVLDASVLTSIVNSDDAEHFIYHSFFRNYHDEDSAIWVVPGLIFLEFQTVQSRCCRDGKLKGSVFRHALLFIEKCELYQVTASFLARVWELNLYDIFSQLKRADLLYACIAKVDGILLVTHDVGFDRYSSELTIIKPRELYRFKGEVSIEHNGKTYKASYLYDMDGEIVEVEARSADSAPAKQVAHRGGFSAQSLAQILLRELVKAGRLQEEQQ